MSAKVADSRDLTVIPLARAVKEFLDHCTQLRDHSPNTRRIYKGALSCLIDVCEPGMATHTLNQMHIQMALARAKRGDTDREYATRKAADPKVHRRTGRAPGSLSIDKAAYRQFADFCQANRYLSPYDQPTHKLRNANKRAEEDRRAHERWIVPYGQWETLLEVAGSRHARDRFVVAMGLYGGRRWSDYATMRISDIDLDEETFSFINSKAGGKRVTLPYKLFPEFGREVRRWLAWLAGQFGELDPDWYLVPARVDPTFLMEFDRFQAPSMRPGWPVVMDRPADYYTIWKDVKYALEVIGAPMVKVGPHTMRHSCSNWLLDVQKWALEHVTIWLDHADPATTKRIYLSGGDDGKRLWERYGNGPDETAPPLGTVELRKAKRHLSLLTQPDDEDAA